jgi:hypothetical protein
MRRQSTRALALLAALIALIATPAMASAATGGGGPSPIWGTITLSVGSSAKVTAKILAQVPVDVTCSLNQDGIAAGASTQPDVTLVSVQVSEASGKSIAQGFGSAGAFRCDGSTTHFMVPVLSQNVPFKHGKGIVQANAEADWGPFDPNTGQPAGVAFGNTDLLVIRLK